MSDPNDPNLDKILKREQDIIDYCTLGYPGYSDQPADRARIDCAKPLPIGRRGARGSSLEPGPVSDEADDEDLNPDLVQGEAGVEDLNSAPVQGEAAAGVLKTSPVGHEDGIKVDPFSKLPYDLLAEIIKCLDIKETEKLSRVSRRGRAVITSLPRYKAIMKNASGALSILSETKLATFYSFGQVKAAIESRECTNCGSLGVLVLLTGLERVCYPCRELPVPGDDRFLYKVTKDFPAEIAVPIIHSLSNTYGVGGYLLWETHRLIAGTHLAKATQILKDAGIKKDFTKFLCSSRHLREVVKNRIGYMRLPFVAEDGKITEEAYRCKGCCAGWWKCAEWRLFTRREYLDDHFPHCSEAQKLWADRKA